MFATFSRQDIKGFDEGLLTGMRVIDLQKACDRINHKVLLKKKT